MEPELMRLLCPRGLTRSLDRLTVYSCTLFCSEACWLYSELGEGWLLSSLLAAMCALIGDCKMAGRLGIIL